MPQVTRLSRATVVGCRGSPMGPRPPAAGVGCGCVIDSLLSVSFVNEDCLSARGPKVNDHRDGNGNRSVYLRVNFTATYQLAADRDLVRVLEVAAHGEPTGDTGHPEPQRLEQPGEVHRRRFAFDVRVGGEDHLFDALVVHPRQELLDLQLFRPDALDRRDRAQQHVVTAAVLLGPLDGDDVTRFLDDAQQRGVASIVAAVDAQLALGEVEAAPAPAHALLRLDDGTRETVGVLGRGLQQVEGDALRRFGADAGEPSQLVDQALHRPFEGGCHLVSAERAAEARAEPAEIDAARDRAHPLGLELLGSSHRLADRGHDQILEHLDVVGVDHVGRDPHRLDVARARHHGGYFPAAGGTFDQRGGQLVLRRGHVGLHLLHLAHHLVELLLVRHVWPDFVGGADEGGRHSWWRSSTTVAPNDSVSMFAGLADSTPGGVAPSSDSTIMSSLSSGPSGGSAGADAARSPLNPSCGTRLNRKLVPTCRDSASRIVSASRRNRGRAASMSRGDTPKVTTSPSTDSGCASCTALRVATDSSGSTVAHARMTSSTSTVAASVSASAAACVSAFASVASFGSAGTGSEGTGSEASATASGSAWAGGAGSGRRLRSAPTVTPGARDSGAGRSCRGPAPLARCPRARHWH